MSDKSQDRGGYDAPMSFSHNHEYENAKTARIVALTALVHSGDHNNCWNCSLVGDAHRELSNLIGAPSLQDDIERLERLIEEREAGACHEFLHKKLERLTGVKFIPQDRSKTS